MIYKQEITNLKEKFAQNGYPKKFLDEILERFDMNNSDCHNEKLKRFDKSTLHRQTKYRIQKETRKTDQKLC